MITNYDRDPKSFLRNIYYKTAIRISRMSFEKVIDLCIKTERWSDIVKSIVRFSSPSPESPIASCAHAHTFGMPCACAHLGHALRACLHLRQAAIVASRAKRRIHCAPCGTQNKFKSAYTRIIN